MGCPQVGAAPHSTGLALPFTASSCDRVHHRSHPPAVLAAEVVQGMDSLRAGISHFRQLSCARTHVNTTCSIRCLQVQAPAGPATDADPRRQHTWTNEAFEDVAAATHKVCSCPCWAPVVWMCMQAAVVLQKVLLAIPRPLSLLWVLPLPARLSKLI